MRHRIVAAALAVLLCISLLPAGAYSDIADVDTAEAVAVLAGMGIVDGYADGAFRPDEPLTRAQFCKLAVLLQGKGDQVAQNAYRALFSDVSATHWALGYVNLAYSDGLVSGYGNGKFGPDDAVTAAQAVTVLLHVLGYENSDIGPFWPEDYLTKAAKLGLTEGLALSADAPLTRGQAALLLYHALGSDTAEGKTLLSTWAPSTVEGAVLMDVSAQSDDGRTGTVQVYAGETISWYDPASAQSADLEGHRGTLLLNLSGKVVGFVPEENSSRTLSLSKVAADGLTDTGGGTHTVAGTVKALSAEKTSTYSELWYELENSSSAILFYTAGGDLDLVYFLDGGRYSGTLVTGYYEKAVPNTASPTQITLLGMTLDVADGAGKVLSQFKVGEKLTVALDGAGQVTAAYAATDKKSDNIGVLTAVSGSAAKVTLLSGLAASGTLTSSTDTAQTLVSGLVKVTSTGVGKVSITGLGGSSSSGKWDLTAGTVGKVQTADTLQVYDQVSGVAATAVDPANLAMTTVAAENISYVGRDSAGAVNLIVLNDVTGDCYTYGFLRTGTQSGGSDDLSYTNYTVAVESSAGTGTACLTGTQAKEGAVAGLALAGSERVAGLVYLTQASNVSRADFSGEEAVNVHGYLIPVSSSVQVYNEQNGQWMTLAEAKAYTDHFGVYYDKTPATGGQVRLVVIQ